MTHIPELDEPVSYKGKHCLKLLKARYFGGRYIPSPQRLASSIREIEFVEAESNFPQRIDVVLNKLETVITKSRDDELAHANKQTPYVDMLDKLIEYTNDKMRTIVIIKAFFNLIIDDILIGFIMQ